MFERRLRMFFGILVGVTGLLVLRAAQLQVWGAEDWRKKAVESLTKTQLLETPRGTIRDFRDNVLAIDEPCIDAVVDYRAITEDPKWMMEVALRRLNRLPDDSYRKADREKRKAMQQAAQERVRGDIGTMWRALAEVSGRSIDEIEEVKSQIKRKVLMRQRHVWYMRYQAAKDDQEDQDEEAWYARWLSGGDEPQLDSFSIEVSEQSESHVVLRDVSDEAHNLLKKRIDDFPGLDLRPGQRRYYPYGASAAHVIGTLGPVFKEDQLRDPHRKDELRNYRPNDRIGRSGVEKYADDVLRGVRGRITKVEGKEQADGTSAPEAGEDVKLTIDIHLQQEIEEAFKSVEFYRKENRRNVVIESPEMYGAAVVIDVKSGQVRALVSNPTFDLNEFDERFHEWAGDKLNRPLVNRATMAALVPGSTVKPIVGLGAITQGLMRPDECIECRGHLYIDGKKLEHGRCWTVAAAAKFGVSPEHHPFPEVHPTGHLNLADALQRSCNVFFETVGDRMKLEGLSDWYEKFGLGSPTGIGIGEARGAVPSDYREIPTYLRRSTAWYGAIGQGHVLATPVQMANVMATIAREGVWVRPSLVASPGIPPRPTTRPVVRRPDREDLRLSREGLRMVHKGMFDAVNTLSGTGHGAGEGAAVVFAGKTGSAQASPFSIIVTGDDGKPLRAKDGRVVREEFEVSTPSRPNHKMRWYRSPTDEGKLSHAWFVGYAPAENPKVAFAIMMEYGGGGGECAPIVKALLEACVEHGYLERSMLPATPVAAR